MTRKSIVLLVNIAAAAVLTAVAVLHHRPTIEVGYAEVTTGDIRREVLTTGTLEPAKAVDTGSQVSGTVQALDVDFNSRVRAGQVIATLDPSSYDTQVAQAQAAVARRRTPRCCGSRSPRPMRTRSWIAPRRLRPTI